MFYHVRITQKSQKAHDEVKVDLSEEQLRLKFLDPYEQGEPIIINGKTIQISDIERIRISKSECQSSKIIQRLKQKDSQSPIMVLGGPSYEWRAADEARDVTDEFIQGPPGYKRGPETKTMKELDMEKSKKKVFIVHGHDHVLKSDLEVFLREIGLEPIVLHRQVDEGLTVIEKFERHSDVRYAFVLLTPDDVGFSVEELKLPEDEREIEYRARQNVLFEFGFFVGKIGRHNVCCIYREGVTLPSDLNGLIYKKVSGSIEEIGYSLIKELKSAGLSPEL